MIVLGIETSCDETAIALVRDGTDVLSSVIASSADLHAVTGGVVPEVASREHVGQMSGVLARALQRSQMRFADIDAIAVTNRPGLLGALMTGVSAAKALSYALGIPLIGIHHIEAHIYANWLKENPPEYPLVALVASGGHTEVFYVQDHCDYAIAGRTRDDAAGEAFDKCARLLGLPYPGGRLLDQLAAQYKFDQPLLRFPQAELGADSLDFSYSGFKTAVLRAVQEKPPAPEELPRWAASIQEAIIAPLAEKTIRAAERFHVKQICLAGGVAANSRLQARISELCGDRGIQLSVPPREYCTDNAAMIASAGYFRFMRGERSGWDLDVIASERLV